MRSTFALFLLMSLLASCSTEVKHNELKQDLTPFIEAIFAHSVERISINDVADCAAQRAVGEWRPDQVSMFGDTLKRLNSLRASMSSEVEADRVHIEIDAEDFEASKPQSRIQLLMLEMQNFVSECMQDTN